MYRFHVNITDVYQFQVNITDVYQLYVNITDVYWFHVNITDVYQLHVNITDVYRFHLESEGQGQVKVLHYGVLGRVCSKDWDDNDATVVCRGEGYQNGLAYQHSEDNVLQEARGPYWLGGFQCTGNETSLLDCPHLNRTSLDNCTNYDIASVLCYNESGMIRQISDRPTFYWFHIQKNIDLVELSITLIEDKCSFK